MAERRRLSREAAGKALAIDPEREFARTLLLLADPQNHPVSALLAAGVRAARKRPSDPEVLRTLNWNLLGAGYVEEALRSAENLVELDPLSAMAHVRLAAALLATGRWEAARVELEAANQLAGQKMNWYLGEVYLAKRQDQAAIARFEAAVHAETQERADPGWIRDLVTGARDPLSGQSHLDRRIPEILESPPSEIDYDSWDRRLNTFYLLLGFFDRYFEIIRATEQVPFLWSEAEYYLMLGMCYRTLGFTANPGYLELAARIGLVEAWEQRGAPDFCAKTDGRWVCQ